MGESRHLNPKLYLRGRPRDKYKNCVDCGAWARVNAAGRCESCCAVDRHLMTLARQLLQHNPNLSATEIADTLGIPEDRISDWVLDRKIKTQVVKHRCPDCGRLMVNTFSCDSCGYGKPPDPIAEEKKKKREKELTKDRTKIHHPPRPRVEKNSDAYWDSVSQISEKYQNRGLLIYPISVSRGHKTS